MKLNNTLFVLDTETGGLDPNSASLMQIAGVVLQNGKPVYQYQSLVKSKDGTYMCNDFARRMHGITDEEINKYGKYPEEIVYDLKLIKDNIFDGEPMTIVAHNAAFDISFVKKMFVDAGIELSSTTSANPFEYNNIFSRNAIDTATMALILRLQGKLDFDRCSLDNILKYYNISSPDVERHTALGDAKQTAKAFLCMFRELSNEKVKHNTSHTEYDTDFDDSKKL